MTIIVYWNHGCPSNSTEDEARAIAAAEKVLGSIDPLAASLAYEAQLDTVDDLSEMTGLAGLWRDAEQAANVALTQGWHDPDAGSCYLVAN